MTLGFILKLKELKCPESSYSYLISHISQENKLKYNLQQTRSHDLKTIDCKISV